MKLKNNKILRFAGLIAVIYLFMFLIAVDTLELEYNIAFLATTATLIIVCSLFFSIYSFTKQVQQKNLDLPSIAISAILYSMFLIWCALQPDTELDFRNILFSAFILAIPWFLVYEMTYGIKKLITKIILKK